MSLQQLDKELDTTLQTFNEEIVFMLDTFDQSHQDEYLTKDDMEEIGRQVFYTLHEFKDALIKHLWKESR